MRQSLIDLDNIVRSDAPFVVPFDENKLKISKILAEIEKKYESQLEMEAWDKKKFYQNVVMAYQTGNDSLIPTTKLKYLPLLFFFSYGGSPMPAEDEGFCEYIIKQLRTRVRTRRALSTAIHVYLCCYDPSSKAVHKIGAFIKEELNKLETCGKRLQRWKNLSFIFREDGIAKFVETMGVQDDMRLFFDVLDFPASVRWGGFVKTAISSYFSSPLIPCSKKYSSLSGCFEYDQKNYNGCPFSDILASSANALIPWANSADNEKQGFLRQFYLQYLGDPRLINATKWHSITTETKKIFIQWLAKFDLETFFSIIKDTATDPGWEYRMRFWKAYLPYFENTWVALGPEARRLANRVRRRDEDAQYLKYATMRGSTSSQSIFIFEIRGYIFVEWSHRGALRVWQKGNSPVTIGAMMYEATNVRSGMTAYEKRHYPYVNYSWQEDVRAWLLKNCGIAPQCSYRV